MSDQDQDNPLQTDPDFKERYINPFTDYGSKRLFGEVGNKAAAQQEEIFEQAFRTAEIARFTPEQRLHYEDSLKYYRDLKNSIDTAFGDGDEQGFARGLVEGQEIGSLKARQEIARSLLDLIPDNATLASKTGLTAEQVQALRNGGEPV